MGAAVDVEAPPPKMLPPDAGALEAPGLPVLAPNKEGEAVPEVLLDCAVDESPPNKFEVDEPLVLAPKSPPEDPEVLVAG